jgi:transposase-like protein
VLLWYGSVRKEAIVAQRRKHTGQFKARVAVEAIAGHKTVNQIAAEYGVHPSQVNKWKKHALEGLPEVLCDGRGGNNGRQEEIEARLYQQIGLLTMELGYLKKKLGFCH